jgi:hypothetical protein
MLAQIESQPPTFGSTSVTNTFYIRISDSQIIMQGFHSQPERFQLRVHPLQFHSYLFLISTAASRKLVFSSAISSCTIVKAVRRVATLLVPARYTPWSLIFRFCLRVCRMPEICVEHLRVYFAGVWSDVHRTASGTLRVYFAGVWSDVHRAASGTCWRIVRISLQKLRSANCCRQPLDLKVQDLSSVGLLCEVVCDGV